MIFGIGTDICNIKRIEQSLSQFGKRFEERCFTEIEQNYANNNPNNRANAYAKRFAAKEAFVKALGTGLRFGMLWREIGVINDEIGRPILQLTGKTLEKLQSLTPQGFKANIFLSISDDTNYAMAYVIIEFLQNELSNDENPN